MNEGGQPAPDNTLSAESDDDKRLRDFAHEIRTPLTAVLGYTKMISDAEKLGISPQKFNEYAGYVNAAATDMLRLCERVLNEAITGADIVELQPVDFREFGASLVRLYAVIAQDAGVDLKLVIDDDFPATVLSDPILLGQALGNLVSNAIKFTPKGGRVTVKGVVDHAERALVLVVQDTGTGMPAWLVQRLVQGGHGPASGAVDQAKGWGRGLQIAKECVDKIAGEIQIASEEGGGTVVMLRFPIDPGQEPG